MAGVDVRGMVVFALCLPIAVVCSLPYVPSLFPPPAVETAGSAYPASKLTFFRESVSGAQSGSLPPQIANVQVCDIDGDGTAEVLACDVLGSRLVRFDRTKDGSWRETTLVDDVAAPAHATPVDLDGDGDRDLVVAVLGSIIPSDETVGRVEWFERVGDSYRRHVLLDDIRRVADVQPCDFDADGDIDLAVAVFGYARGEILWLENRGDGSFADHLLLPRVGGIHVPVADFDGDGDSDFAAVVSQHLEEIWGFENLGNGQFERRMLWRTPNFDLGSAGLVVADLDRDGDADLILPAGDNLEDFAAFPQPYHGCYWLENLGNWQFREHRISDLGGTYAAAVGDLDGDGDADVALVSLDNDWRNPANASIVWLENDGQQQFRSWQIDAEPIHLVTVATGDIDGDGRTDLVAGSLNLRRPRERMGGVTAWFNRGRLP
jgi:hypothetical protein